MKFKLKGRKRRYHVRFDFHDGDSHGMEVTAPSPLAAVLIASQHVRDAIVRYVQCWVIHKKGGPA